MLIRKLISLSRDGIKNTKIMSFYNIIVHVSQSHQTKVSAHHDWSLTVVGLNFVQEIDALQMFGCGHRQGEYIANGLVEARVGSIAEGHWLVFVLQEVLDMAHLMVHRDQVIHSHNSALLDPGDTNKAIIMAI